MASLGDNIRRCAVRGTFDDCQRLVKQAFADDELRAHVWLTPANSINLGRLLPQVFYYFLLAGLRRAEPGPMVSVPSGNFGNLTAGLIAKRHRAARAPVRGRDQRQRRGAASTCGPDIYEPRPSIADGGQRHGRGRAEQFRADAVALRRRPRRRCGATSSGFAYDDARVDRRDRRVSPQARLPARSARRHRLAGPAGSAGGRSGCVRRVSGHGASGQVPRGRRAGDRAARPAAACPGRCLVPPAALRVDAGRLRCARRIPAGCVRFRTPNCPDSPRPSQARAPRARADDLPPEPRTTARPGRRSPYPTRGTSATSAEAGTSGRESYRELEAIEAFKSRRARWPVAPERCSTRFARWTDIGALSYRVWYYASLHYDEDQRNNDINARRQQVQILFARQQQASAWFNPELLAIPLETIRQWMEARPGAGASTASPSRALFHEQEHVLDEQGERLLSYASRFDSVPHDSYAALTTADMKSPTIALGAGERVDPELRAVPRASSRPTANRRIAPPPTGRSTRSTPTTRTPMRRCTTACCSATGFTPGRAATRRRSMRRCTATTSRRRSSRT